MPNVRKRAEQAGEAFIEMMNPWTTRLVLPVLYTGFEGRRNWQVGSWSATPGISYPAPYHSPRLLTR